MDVNKYVVPTLPSAQHILEDFADPAIIKADQPLNLSADDETLQNAFKCHQNFKQLQADLQTQSNISSNLEELNKKLVESIGNMKAQIKKN